MNRLWGGGGDTGTGHRFARILRNLRAGKCSVGGGGGRNSLWTQYYCVFICCVINVDLLNAKIYIKKKPRRTPICTSLSKFSPLQ